MAEGTLSRWPSVRQMLSTYAEDVGYLSLQTYYPDRGGEQVGRFDVTNEFLARWLPSKDDDDSGSIDFNLGTVDTQAEDNEDAPDAVGEPTEEGESDEAGGGDTSEGASDPVDPVDLLNAARAWLYETCEDNTLDGESQRFRLRIHSERGKKQLWSGILDYDSGKEKPRESHQPVELPTFERKPVFTDDEESSFNSDTPTHPPSPDERYLSDEEIAFSELLMEHQEDDDLLDFTDELGGSTPPAELEEMFTPSTTFGRESPTTTTTTVVKRRSRKKVGPSTPKGAPSQAIQSLMHLHKSHKEFIDTVLATTKQLVKVQASAMDQLAGTLGDSRNRENALVSAVQGLRIAEAESAVDAAKAQDASQVRSVLGKEAIAQMGLLGQVLLTRNQQDNGSNGAGHTQPRALPEHEPPQIAEPPSNGSDLYPDMSQGVDLEGIEEGEPPEVDEAKLINLLGWAQSRPDVLEALTDPSVRSYLHTPENVEQLMGLARMLSPTSVAPASPPVPTDLEDGTDSPHEDELNPETLESSVEENPSNDNEQE